jgi:hypothetical protein
MSATTTGVSATTSATATATVTTGCASHERYPSREHGRRQDPEGSCQ